jgi:hypothetical protein
MGKSIPIGEVFPLLAQELQSLLIARGEPGLAAQVPKLGIEDRCRCFDDYCSTFYTRPRPQGGFGPDHRSVPLAPTEGEIILDVVDEVIVAVEVFHRTDITRDRLATEFP